MGTESEFLNQPNHDQLTGEVNRFISYDGPDALKYRQNRITGILSDITDLERRRLLSDDLRPLLLNLGKEPIVVKEVLGTLHVQDKKLLETSDPNDIDKIKKFIQDYLKLADILGIRQGILKPDNQSFSLSGSQEKDPYGVQALFEEPSTKELFIGWLKKYDDAHNLAPDYHSSEPQSSSAQNSADLISEKIPPLSDEEFTKQVEKLRSLNQKGADPEIFNLILESYNQYSAVHDLVDYFDALFRSEGDVTPQSLAVLHKIANQITDLKLPKDIPQVIKDQYRAAVVETYYLQHSQTT